VPSASQFSGRINQKNPLPGLGVPVVENCVAVTSCPTHTPEGRGQKPWRLRRSLRPPVMTSYAVAPGTGAQERVAFAPTLVSVMARGALGAGMLSSIIASQSSSIPLQVSGD